MTGWRGRNNPGRPLLVFATRVHVMKRESLWALGLLLVRQIKLELSRPGKGRLRRRGKSKAHKAFFGRDRRGRFLSRGKSGNRASAPGDPPAVDLNNLRGSIDIEAVGSVIRVGTNVAYAEPLEFGTRTAGKSRRVVILPRPFMRPALRKVARIWNGTIVTHLKFKNFTTFGG